MRCSNCWVRQWSLFDEVLSEKCPIKCPTIILSTSSLSSCFTHPGVTNYCELFVPHISKEIVFCTTIMKPELFILHFLHKRGGAMSELQISFVNPYWTGRTYMSLSSKGQEGHICPTIVMSCWHHCDIISSGASKNGCMAFRGWCIF